MQDLNTLMMFAAASLLLALAPGPDNIFVLTQSMLYGRSAGFAVVAGLCTGLLFHTAIVSLGIAVIFQTSPEAFNMLRFAGAAYLLYLAYGAIRASMSVIKAEDRGELSRGILYRRGIIMNITNPKVSIFFIAFLPQFTDPSRASIRLQMFLLGFIFILCTVAVFGMICQLAGTFGRILSRSVFAGRFMNVLTGLIFAALAVRLVLG